MIFPPDVHDATSSQQLRVKDNLGLSTTNTADVDLSGTECCWDPLHAHIASWLWSF